MARFRSGTLERSVKRFGRMPSFNKFQRKSHGWKYVELIDSSIDLSGTVGTVAAIFTATDVAPGTIGGTGVRNVAADLVVGVTWSPQTTALSFDSWAITYGFFCLDNDDTSDTIDETFGATRAIDWHMWARNSVEDGEGGSFVNDRHMQRRARWRQRFVRFDERIIIMAQANTSITSTISDMRLHIFGRVSWENP